MRHTPLNAKIRSQITSELDQYNAYKSRQKIHSDQYIISQLNRDNLPVEISEVQTSIAKLGADRTITQEQILKKHAITENAHRRRTIESLKKNVPTPGSVWTKPRLLKKRVSVAAPEATSLVKTIERKIESQSEIPKFFDSPEGLTALTKLEWVSLYID